MAEEQEEKVTKKKTKARNKTPKITVGDYPYVNLMPTSRQDAIDRAAAKTKWLKIVAGAMIAAVVLSGLSVGYRILQQFTYDGVISEQEDIEAEISQYAEVDNALTVKDTVEGNIVTVTATSINWQDLHSRIASNLPAGSYLGTLKVQTGGKAIDANSVAVTVNVTSQQPIAYSNILVSFGKVPGILPDSLIIGDLIASTGSTDGSSVYNYPIAFKVDTSILAKNFAYLTDDEAEAVETPEEVQEEELPIIAPEDETNIIEDAENAVDEANANSEGENE